MHMRRPHAQIPLRTHTHSGRACALSPAPSPGPTRPRTVPWPGARADVCVQGLADRLAGLRVDKINTPSLASSSHGWALRHDQFYESNPFEGMATP